MKGRIVGIVVACLVLGLAGQTAVAWDDANRTVSKLGVETIENPSSTNITASDIWTFATNVIVNGKVEIAGSATVTGTFSAGATNITAGTVLNAVSGANVTNLNAANIRAGTVVTAISGLAITNMSASNISQGNLAFARMTNGLSEAAVTVGSLTTTGIITAVQYKIGAIAGWGGVITNGVGTGVTNYLYLSGGLVTNSVTTALP